MKYGTWGSRFPLDNFIFTRLLLFGVRWRIWSRRFINRIRGILSPQPTVQERENDTSTSAALERWLADGYDRLNVGGGSKNLAGFVNLDFVAHTSVVREVCANILDLSFVPCGRIVQIHSNHLIEHLSYIQIAAQLSEYYRVLRPGGLLSLRCPNALGASYAFWFDPILEDNREEFIALGFPPDEDFGNPLDAWLHKDFYGVLHWFYGDVGNIENQHLSRLTPTILRNFVEKAGFQILRMTKPESINLVLVALKPTSD